MFFPCYSQFLSIMYTNIQNYKIKTADNKGCLYSKMVKQMLGFFQLLCYRMLLKCWSKEKGNFICEKAKERNEEK